MHSSQYDEAATLFLKIDNLHLDLIYEGLNSLCIKCGIVGHKEQTCRFNRATKCMPMEPPEIKPGKDNNTIVEEENKNTNLSRNTQFNRETLVEEEIQHWGYHPWMVVQDRKKTPTKSSRTSSSRVTLGNLNHGRSPSNGQNTTVTKEHEKVNQVRLMAIRGSDREEQPDTTISLLEGKITMDKTATSVLHEEGTTDMDRPIPGWVSWTTRAQEQ